MPHLPPWLQPSARCRLEWRPSRWLVCLLLILGACAALSLLLSGLPGLVIWPGALLALGYSALLSRQEIAAPVVEIQLDDQIVQVNGEPVQGFRVFWRGPLVFARWRDAGNRMQRLVWWPDTLDPSTRRELKLALPREVTARGRRSVAT